MSHPLAVAFTMLFAAGGVAADVHEFAQAGTVHVDAGAVRDARLRVLCTPDRSGGALGIELTISEANARKDFDYDDFEGPDAEAANHVLSRLDWTSGTKSTSITDAAGGWYVPEPAEAFTFGVSQLSFQHEPPARLLAAVDGAPGTLVWTQNAADKSGRRLIATFDLDATAAKRLRDAAAACLPNGGKSGSR